MTNLPALTFRSFSATALILGAERSLSFTPDPDSGPLPGPGQGVLTVEGVRPEEVMQLVSLLMGVGSLARPLGGHDVQAPSASLPVPPLEQAAPLAVEEAVSPPAASSAPSTAEEAPLPDPPVAEVRRRRRRGAAEAAVAPAAAAASRPAAGLVLNGRDVAAEASVPEATPTPTEPAPSTGPEPQVSSLPTAEKVMPALSLVETSPDAAPGDYGTRPTTQYRVRLPDHTAAPGTAAHPRPAPAPNLPDPEELADAVPGWGEDMGLSGKGRHLDDVLPITVLHDDDLDEDAAPPAPAPAAVVEVLPGVRVPKGALEAAPKMWDAMQVLMAVGINTQQQLIAACEAAKPYSPALARCTDVADRVPRALGVRGIALAQA